MTSDITILLNIDIKKKGKSFHYTKFDSIPYPYIEHVVSIKCTGDNIKYIPFFPNLTNLECINSSIKTIPSYPKLETLICTRNFLVELPKLPKIKTNEIHKLEKEYLKIVGYMI